MKSMEMELLTWKKEFFLNNNILKEKINIYQ